MSSTQIHSPRADISSQSENGSKTLEAFTNEVEKPIASGGFVDLNPEPGDTRPVATVSHAESHAITGPMTLSQSRRVPGLPREIALQPQEYELRFLAEQLWEGTVSTVLPEEFTARLIDSRSGEEDEATLPTSDVSEEDLSLLAPGAEFYFSIGYQYSRSGNIQRCARIRFKRIPRFNADEILDAHARASARAKRVNFE